MNGGNGREHANREALRERLSAYLDGELAPGDAAALERHLASCAECRDELATLREVRALLRALPQPALPRSFALPATASSPAARAPAPTPLPARSRRTPTTVPRLARAAQWVGGLAASFGLLLILATTVLGGNLGHTFSAAAPASGGASSPMQSSTSPQQNATTNPQRTPTRPSVVAGGATPVATPIITPSPSAGAQGSGASPAAPRTPSGASASEHPFSAAEPFPVLPVTGAGLLAGGVVLFASGSVAARRRRQHTR